MATAAQALRLQRRRKARSRNRIPFNAKTIGEGDSLFSYVDGRSIIQWLNVFLNGRLRWAPNGVAATEANAGDDWNDLQGDIPGTISEHTPDLVLIHCGTNSTNVTVPFVDALNDADDVVRQLNDAGAKVVYLQILPRADANAAGKEADRLKNEQFMLQMQRRRDLLVIDAADVYDPSDPLQSTDLTHQLTPAANAIARRLADVLDPLIGNGDPRDVVGANMLVNADFATGTGGTLATGMAGGSVIPANWTVDNDTGATVTSSVVTRADGSKAIRLDVSGSATTDTLDLRVFQLVTFNFEIGDAFELIGDLKISGAGGVGAPTGLNGWAMIGGSAVCFTQSQAANLGGMNFAVDNTIRCAPRPNSGSGASFTAGVYFRWAIGVVAARIEFSLPHVAEVV